MAEVSTVGATHLADKSALARVGASAIGARLGPMIVDGLIATCALVDLEVLYSARSLADYEAVLDERAGFQDVPITPEVMQRAIDLQHDLARRGQHRLPLPDLIISAAAESVGLAVLHYDADFDRIAAVGGARSEWIVPAGSL